MVLIIIAIIALVYLFAGHQSTVFARTGYARTGFSFLGIISFIRALMELMKQKRTKYVIIGLALFIVLGAVSVFWFSYNWSSHYVDSSLSKQPQAENILLIVVTDFKEAPTERDFTVENQIREVMSSRGFIPRDNFFKPLFAQEGHLFDVYSGNTSMLRRLKIEELIDYLMLAEISKEFSKSEVTEVITCNVDLTYKILDSSGQLVKSGTVSAAGPGFSKAAAEKKAIEKIADKIGKVVESL
jgi:hypothetical protein